MDKELLAITKIKEQAVLPLFFHNDTAVCIEVIKAFSSIPGLTFYKDVHSSLTTSALGGQCTRGATRQQQDLTEKNTLQTNVFS